MEEIEAPIESIMEDIHHHAQHAQDRWISQVAVSSAVIAVLAAVVALLANHHSNEAMIEQIRASDQWSYFQSKSIKSSLLTSKMDLLASLGKEVSKKDQEKLQEYKQEQESISETAQHKEELAENHLKHHVILARGVTLFQISIAIAAIALLTQRRRFWYLGLTLAAVGLAFVVQGVFLI